MTGGIEEMGELAKNDGNGAMCKGQVGMASQVQATPGIGIAKLTD